MDLVSNCFTNVLKSLVFKERQNDIKMSGYSTCQRDDRHSLKKHFSPEQKVGK